jgi:hypothetical protein
MQRRLHGGGAMRRAKAPPSVPLTRDCHLPIGFADREEGVGLMLHRRTANRVGA